MVGSLSAVLARAASCLPQSPRLGLLQWQVWQRRGEGAWIRGVCWVSGVCLLIVHDLVSQAGAGKGVFGGKGRRRFVVGCLGESSLRMLQ